MKKISFKQIQYHVAYRQDGEINFHVVKNNKGTWSADPFLFEYKGEMYIFAEMWVITKGKGVIAYSKWDGEKFSEWNPVIEENYHLSYPNIFMYNGEIYLCPESNENKDICIYRAKEFPNKWEKIHTLLSGDRYVDTTFFEYKNGIYGFTYRLCEDKEKNGELYLFKISDEKIAFLADVPISNDDKVARPAGNCIEYMEKLIRVSQNCQGIYGKGLMFSEIEFDGRKYKEYLIREIYPKDITCENTDGINIIGIHTYNQRNGFEVIDLRSCDFSVQLLAEKIIGKVKRMLRKD